MTADIWRITNNKWQFSVQVPNLRVRVEVVAVAVWTAVRVVKLLVWSQASEWVTQLVTLWRVVGGRWHMRGQAPVVHQHQPLPIRPCPQPTLHSQILRTNICYAPELNFLPNSQRTGLPRFPENITRKIHRLVPAPTRGKKYLPFKKYK